MFCTLICFSVQTPYKLHVEHLSAMWTCSMSFHLCINKSCSPLLLCCSHLLIFYSLLQTNNSISLSVLLSLLTLHLSKLLALFFLSSSSCWSFLFSCSCGKEFSTSDGRFIRLLVNPARPAFIPVACCLPVCVSV